MLDEIQNIIWEIREFRKEVSDAIEKINEKLNDHNYTMDNKRYFNKNI